VTDFPATGSPPFVNRALSVSQWASYIAAYRFGALSPTKVVLHHTWRPTLQQWAGLRSMQGLQRFYAGKGWPAAPHLFVGPDAIWLATPLRDIGVHAGEGNGSVRAGWYSIGVEMVGDYDRQRPSGPVWELTKAVVGGLSRRLGIPPRQLLDFHRDYSQKSCPGWSVSKDWVIGEVEAWLAGRPAPPPPPPGLIGWPPPEVEELFELLMDRSYRQRAEGYNSEWAFHQFAFRNALGFPVGRSTRVTVAGRIYAFQPFARDTLFCEVPSWGEVRRLSELLAGSIPPAGTLGYALLDATYRAGSTIFNPALTFHQYAMAGRTVGPPLAPAGALALDGARFIYQVYATDTLYAPATIPDQVQRLSGLGGATPATARLRDELLEATYRAAGQDYRPDWAFHQMARTLALGAPLGRSDPVALGARQYNFQVYATDTLYNIIPNWADVRRLSRLLIPPQAGGPAILSAEETPTSRTQPKASSDGVRRIIRYQQGVLTPTAAYERGGSRIELIVLHDEPGPAEATLAEMTLPGARRLVHYLVALDGTVYQLLDDALAAQHAGMGMWRGTQRNLNRISLGVALERTERSAPAAQRAALEWLLAELRARHTLAHNAVVRWKGT
jgi:hypothetical protein